LTTARVQIRMELHPDPAR